MKRCLILLLATWALAFWAPLAHAQTDTLATPIERTLVQLPPQCAEWAARKSKWPT